MITIDQLNITVTVEDGAEPGDATFVRLFNRCIELWWREMRQRAARDARSADARRLVGPQEGDT
jgi:hypothetical protein